DPLFRVTSPDRDSVHGGALLREHLQLRESCVGKAVRALIGCRELLDSGNQGSADFTNHIFGRLADMPQKDDFSRTGTFARAQFPTHPAVFFTGERTIELAQQFPEGAHRNKVSARPQPTLAALQFHGYWLERQFFSP